MLPRKGTKVRVTFRSRSLPHRPLAGPGPGGGQDQGVAVASLLPVPHHGDDHGFQPGAGAVWEAPGTAVVAYGHRVAAEEGRAGRQRAWVHRRGVAVDASCDSFVGSGLAVRHALTPVARAGLGVDLFGRTGPS